MVYGRQGLARDFGTVNSVKIFEDANNGKSKGAAEIEFAELSAAAKCKAALHGCAAETRSHGSTVEHAWLLTALHTNHDENRCCCSFCRAALDHETTLAKNCCLLHVLMLRMLGSCRKDIDGKACVVTLPRTGVKLKVRACPRCARDVGRPAFVPASRMVGLMQGRRRALPWRTQAPAAGPMPGRGPVPRPPGAPFMGPSRPPVSARPACTYPRPMALRLRPHAVLADVSRRSWDEGVICWSS